MRFKKISTKLFLITFVSIALTSSAVLIPMIRDMGQVITYLSARDVESSMQTIERVIESMASTSIASSSLMANHSLLAIAVEFQNPALVAERVDTLLNTVRTYSQADLVVVTDNQGNVLFRLHNNIINDDISSRPSIAAALDGHSTNELQFDMESPVATIATSPIYRNGVVVGTVVVGYNLAHHRFVDDLKEITGAEVSIFSGKYSVMTTIKLPDGSRSYGFPLAERFILTIFDEARDYYGHVPVLGQPFVAFYRPLFDTNGNVAGAIFSGQSIAEVTRIQREARNFALATTAIAVALILLLTTFLNNRMIATPVRRITEALELLSNGHLITKNAAKHTSADEIGQLSRSTDKTTNVIRSVLDDLEVLMKQRTNGDTKVRFDITKYEGAFSKLVEQFNQMFDEEVVLNADVFEAIQRFSDGDFTLQMRQFPGDRAMFNRSLETLQINLSGISQQTQNLLKHALDGNLEKRADTSAVKGEWGEILKNLNTLMESVATPIEEATKVLSYIEQGDFSKKVTGEYKGVFDNIKTSVNTTENVLRAYVHEISNVLTEMANDNFRQRIDTPFYGDFARIKTALFELMKKFNSIITSISGTAEEVLTGAKQLSISSGSLADGSNAQAAVVQELSASIENITSKIQNDFETAKTVGKVSASSKETATLGNEHMKNMLASMQSISDAAKSISATLKTIDGIAFQTNLLALNAAVEAARAGEHGKGFNVVAEEVRVLAGRSEVAAKESSELINDALLKVAEGQRVAQETAITFEKIVGNTSKVGSLIVNVENQAREKQEAMLQIGDGIKQISDVVLKNTSISEEVAASASVLNDRAKVMNDIVEIYRKK